MADREVNVFSVDSAKRIANVVRDAEREGDPSFCGTSPRAARGRPIIGKIESAATGGGFYKGRRLFKPTPAAINVATGFVESMLGAAGGDEIYMANLLEIGKTTHDLTASGNAYTKYFEIRPWTVATDGKPIFLILALWLKKCS